MPSTIPEAIEDFRTGRMVVVVDDEDRENEGDLTIAAEKITPEAINFMARYGRGLICLPMTGERLDELRIPLMVRASIGTQNAVPKRALFCSSRTISGMRSSSSRSPVIGRQIRPRP